MSDRERDDIDLATAAEQSSEVEEVQEGSTLDQAVDSVEPAEHAALHIDGDSEGDLDEELDALVLASDPEADEIVEDALDIDSPDEADASVSATDDEADIEAEEEASDDDDVTPYTGPEPDGGEDVAVSPEDAELAAAIAELESAATAEHGDDAAATSTDDAASSDDTDAVTGADADTGAEAAFDGDAGDVPAGSDAAVESERPLGAIGGTDSDGTLGDDALSGEAFDDAVAAVDEAEETEVDPYEEFRSELRSKPGKWYVIHSYAGFEKRVKSNIENRKVSMAMEDYVFQVEVPMEDVVEIKNGQRKLVNRVRIPGYVLVRMDLNEDSWSVVRHTPGVTGFVGNSHNPTPLRFEEAFSMLKSLVQIVEAPVKAGAKGGKTTQRSIPQEVDFEIGETITIKEGSFAGLPGSISDIRPESGKLTVLVSLFERETPVELSFDQVTKL